MSKNPFEAREFTEYTAGVHPEIPQDEAYELLGALNGIIGTWDMYKSTGPVGVVMAKWARDVRDKVARKVRLPK